jgi:hypothetical protein
MLGAVEGRAVLGAHTEPLVEEETMQDDRHARSKRGLLVLALVAGMLVLGGASTGSAEARADVQPPAGADPAVISDWSAIKVTTIVGPAPNGAGKANVEAFFWFPFVQAAVYNAVNGITGEYELYKWNARAPKGASPQAAAAAAAHGILMEYFGTGDFVNSETIAANLNTALETSLGQVPDGVPKEQGIRYGEHAAEHIIELREDDGRFAPVVFDMPLAPGVWRPTPPAMAPFFGAWLSQVEPFVLDSPSQFRPGTPPPIMSDLYVEEFEEVRDYGASVGSLRSPEQTETARFFSDVTLGPLQAGLRDLAARRGLDISDSARLFAAVDVSVADTAITVWDGKLHYGWWRPITAIREADTDGNPNTTGVPGWTPFLVTPPYPDWPSGLNGVIGAASTALSRLNADGRVDVSLTSAAAGVTRHYDFAADIQRDAIDARVFSGIHFRTADAVAIVMGTQVANWALDHHFGPAK